MPKTHLDTSRKAVPATPERPVRAASEPPALLGLLGSGACRSGPALARQLGISRAAVWKQIAALRAAGLEIESGGDGYRLARPLDRLDPGTLLARLPAALRRRIGVLENHWRIDSTSSECLRRAAELPDRSFVFADWQDAGRGRRGRRWVSPPAANLQFSCLKRFSGGYAALSGLSLAVGVAVANALEDCGAAGIGLKWPNDLEHRGEKLGGVLIELGGEFMGPCHAVIGIGINVRVPEAVRRALDRPCTDLADVCGGSAPARNLLAAALIARLVAALDTFDASGFAAFAQAWGERDVLTGRTIRVDDARGAFEGTARGVDARGALQVRCGDGVRSVDSAEVSVRAK